MEYTVVTANQREMQGFVDRVESLIDDGWRPQGGVACGGGGTNNMIDIYYAQAMVRDVEE